MLLKWLVLLCAIQAAVHVHGAPFKKEVVETVRKPSSRISVNIEESEPKECGKYEEESKKKEVIEEKFVEEKKDNYEDDRKVLVEEIKRPRKKEEWKKKVYVEKKERPKKIVVVEKREEKPIIKKKEKIKKREKIIIEEKREPKKKIIIEKKKKKVKVYKPEIREYEGGKQYKNKEYSYKGTDSYKEGKPYERKRDFYKPVEEYDNKMRYKSKMEGYKGVDGYKSGLSYEGIKPYGGIGKYGKLEDYKGTLSYTGSKSYDSKLGSYLDSKPYSSKLESFEEKPFKYTKGKEEIKGGEELKIEEYEGKYKPSTEYNSFYEENKKSALGYGFDKGISSKELYGEERSRESAYLGNDYESKYKSIGGFNNEYGKYGGYEKKYGMDLGGKYSEQRKYDQTTYVGDKNYDSLRTNYLDLGRSETDLGGKYSKIDSSKYTNDIVSKDTEIGSRYEIGSSYREPVGNKYLSIDSKYGDELRSKYGNEVNSKYTDELSDKYAEVGTPFDTGLNKYGTKIEKTVVYEKSRSRRDR